MLEELKIEGFRSLKSVTWRPGKLNVLIGPNGGGKSNLLRALEILKAGAEGKLRDTIIEMGGMAPLLWDGQAKHFSFSLRANIERFFAYKENTAGYLFELTRLGSGGLYEISKEEIWLSKPQNEALFDPEAVFIDSLRHKRLPVRRDLESIGAIDRSVELDLARSISDEDHWVTVLRRLIILTSVVSDVRVDQNADMRQAAISRSEQLIDSNGQNLVAVLHTKYTSSREFEELLDSAMTAAFPDDYEKLVFSPAEDGRIQLRVRRKHRKRADGASDLSDGTLRFLLLATVLCSPEPAPLIAIDEPETGLHPRMLPIIAELAENAAMKTQVVFTTHSPQFLDAFRDEPPTITVVTSDGSETKLATIEGDELRRWIADYSLGRFAFSGSAEAIT